MLSRESTRSLAVSILFSSALLPIGYAASAGPHAAMSSALAGLKEGGWHGAGQLSAPDAGAPKAVKVALTANGELNDAALRKLIKFSDENPLEARMDRTMLGAMGMRVNQEIVVVRQIIWDGGNNRVHLFNRLPGDTGFVLGNVHAGTFLMYRVNRDMSLAGAARKVTGQDAVPLSAADASEGRRRELSLWAEAATKL